MHGRGSWFRGFVGKFWWKGRYVYENGLHIIGKGAAVFAAGFTAAIDRGMCNITNIFL